MNEHMDWLKNKFSTKQGAISTQIGAAILISLTWIVTIGLIIGIKNEAIENEYKILKNVTIGLKQHTQANLRASDEILRVMKFHYETAGYKDLSLVSRYFQEGALNIKFLNQVGIIDEHGIYTFSNLTDHKRLDLSDREHFKVHKAGYTHPLFVSKPVLGRITGKWSFQLTRRFSKSDGSFNGVGTASLNPYEFLNYFKEVQLGTNGVIGLIGLDGYARALRVGTTSRADDTLKGLNLPEEISEQESGYFFSKSFFDTTPRMYAFQKLSDAPLFVIAGIAHEDAFADFERQRLFFISVAILMSLMFVFAAWYKLRATTKDEQTLSELKIYQEIINDMQLIKCDFEGKISALQGLAEVGQLAINFSSELKETIPKLREKVGNLEKTNDSYERFLQTVVRFQMKQISQEELFAIIKSLQLENVIDDARLNLAEIEENVDDIKLFIDSLKRQIKN